ncbi:glycosyltransferase [Cellulomonas uda]|uniref:glycosyltransferase n=1 Tax=Cellulomonas uda TaxID=1714 RepID=UPI00141B4922|nr:glycosyltransferase [Cellulomonas uda]
MVAALLPIVVALLPKQVTRRAAADPLPDAPSIDVIVPAFLEAGVVADKIRALHEDLDSYPGRGRVVVVASDQATYDAAEAADLRILTGRNGKAMACNAGLDRSDADVVVFTDANCEILPRKEWTRHLLEALTTWHLVSGMKSEEGGSEGAFWKFERAVKLSSHDSTGTLAVAGEFVAARRRDVEPLRRGVILDDLDLAMDFALRGLSVTATPRIRTTEPAAEPTDQWERRVRIANGLFREALPRARELVRIPVGRVFVAHKLARVTLGCLGFWAAVLGASLVALPLSVAVLGAVVYAVASYAGRVPLPRALRPVAAICGLQAAPVFGLSRTLARGLRRTRTSTSADGIWTKVAR